MGGGARAMGPKLLPHSDLGNEAVFGDSTMRPAVGSTPASPARVRGLVGPRKGAHGTVRQAETPGAREQHREQGAENGEGRPEQYAQGQRPAFILCGENQKHKNK